MPRVKVARKSTATDMTAMCDVAFLLLTFFILSAKPKVPDPVKAVVPASTAVTKIPETDFAIITIGEGKAFYSIEGADLRLETIQAMMDAYKVPFTKDEITRFVHTENFGVPLSQMPQLLSMSKDDAAKVKQTGIPVDTMKENDLANWVYQTRRADQALRNVELRVAIKADAQQDYPVVDKIIKTLQKQHLDKFSLITSAKTVAK
jgi:biopolymer transport protein ExbD